MKKSGLVVLLIVTAALACSIITVFAQASMSSWPFFVEVTPSSAAPGIYDLVVPFPVMDKAREDLADLRLYDGQGREIPYAVRIRNEVDDKQVMATEVFNQATTGTASEMSVDLGENTGEHNEVEIQTVGENFRRRVEVEGSDSSKEWRTLETGGMLFSFESQNRAVESSRVTYPTS